jgi:alkaline phosphatase
MRSLLATSCCTTVALAACVHIEMTPSPPAEARSAVAPVQASDAWYRAGEETLRSALALRMNDEPARNVILFIGDGMSLSTVTAARMLEGQLRGEPGEENALSFERMPWTGLSKTYSVNAQVSESAATATAMLTGVKTKSAVVAVSGGVTPNDCASALTRGVPTLLELAEDAGLATGVVTTARVTHATPASSYAHAASRYWESDADMPPEAGDCEDIARQLVGFAHGDGIEVVLGGGRTRFLPASAVDPENPRARGARQDGRDLVQAWLQRYGRHGAYVWNSAQLATLDRGGVRHLLGLFQPSHMRYEVDRARDVAGEPSLTEMTRAAIELLRGRGGYFLLVEGGRIDHAHHAGNGYRALHETIEFSNAVRAAMEMTNASETLIVVTADHGHVLDIGGYPVRGNPILGKVRSYGDDGEPEPGDATDLLGLPYTTLSYASGPGYPGRSDVQAEGPKRFPHRPSRVRPAAGRADLGAVDTTAPDYLQEAPVALRSETHSGTDVPVYASGPAAHLLSGAYEQNYIFHVMRHALRL